MDETKKFIYIVDDDASVRQALKMLILSAGMEVKTFELAKQYMSELGAINAPYATINNTGLAIVGLLILFIPVS